MSKLNKFRIIAASIGLVILAAVVFGVMLRGDDGAADAAATTPASTSAPEASSTPASEPAPSDTARATAESAVTTAPIVDDVFGNTITPTAIVRDFQASTPAPAGGEYVLVNVDVTAGNVYYGGFSETELALAAAGSDEEYPATAKTSVIADDMRAAGYTPFEDLESGATGQGWVAFILTEDAPTSRCSLSQLPEGQLSCSSSVRRVGIVPFMCHRVATTLVFLGRRAKTRGDSHPRPPELSLSAQPH